MEDRLDKRRPWNTISDSLPTKPMRKLFTALLLTSFALPLHAERSTVPPRYVSVPEKEAPANKSGDTRSFLQRMFGPRPTPAPVPTPAPAPVAKRRPKPKATVPNVAARVTPKPQSENTTPDVPRTIAKGKPTKGGVKKGATVSGDGAALDDATRFGSAKAKALEDAHIRELKGKADSEVNEAEAHKALVNYNRALFQKIREVDPSVSDYAGRVEQSMTKRIGSEAAKP